SWDSIVDDIDRPLTERGIKNSYEMAARLQEKGLVPEAVYSSPANRALHTAIIMSRVWKIGEEQINICRKLYLPDEENIAATIFGISDTLTSIAVFGHNPGFTEFANRFMKPPVDNVPTAGVVVVSMKLDSWSDLYNGSVKRIVFDYPKHI
ncbi:MAG: histidine phosphatase family protein, partial [Bacteroidales bacterium]|nr:histidine phosphatase family protein [Bacteroidales bacterium]